MKIAFDVDGTLIRKNSNGEDIPHYRILDLMYAFHKLGYELFVWSGGGVDYALRWAEKLGIDHRVNVVPKGSFTPDIAVDDEEVELGRVNLKV